MNGKYLQLDSTSLAEEQEFIAWVREGVNDARWTKWINSNPGQKPKIDEARKIVEVFQFESVDLKIDKTLLWDRIDESVTDNVVHLNQSGHKSRRQFSYALAAIAASMAILFAIMPMLKEGLVVETIYGETITHVLPDQSKVFINAGSRIEYDAEKWEENRTVTLEGEGFFEVEKGVSFTVETDNGDVTVLGTKFNVFSRHDAFKVKCTEGKVQVQSRRSTEVLLAGDETMLDANRKLVRIPFQAKYDWRKGAYSFQKVALERVFEEIERQFNLKVMASEDIKSMSYNGPLETKNLDKALYMVTWPMGLKYTKTEGEVIIEKN